MEKKNKKNRRSSTVWRRILLVVVSVIFGVNVYIWNAGVLGGNSMPMPFGIGSAVVMSGSMEPTLSVNDWVCIRESEEYFVGDVVVYQSGRDLVIHEIIDINDGVVTTKGPANNTADDPIDIQYVKGRLIFAIP
jgi:signal peptidase